MTGLRLIVLGGAIVLAGCTSNGGGGSLFTATAGGLAATATLTGESNVEVEAAEGATTAQIELVNEDQLMMSFSGGSLDGRKIGFDVSTSDGIVRGTAYSGLVEGEETQGNLTAIYDPDGAAFAGVVSVQSGSFAPPVPGSSANLYALYGANPQATHTAYVGNDQLTYSGRFVGNGTDTHDAGGIMGNMALLADFGNGSVTGTIDDIRFSDSSEPFAGGDVGFTATMSEDRASYEGTNVTLDGTSVRGSVLGGFYGVEAAETAGAIFADDEANTALIGGFHGTR